MPELTSDQIREEERDLHFINPGHREDIVLSTLHKHYPNSPLIQKMLREFRLIRNAPLANEEPQRTIPLHGTRRKKA